MKRCLTSLALLALFPAPALGGLVFFDDFEGDALLPHWSLPPPSFWEYNVSNSMLNVTGLFSPSHPKSPSNFAGIAAAFSPQADFQADVWMGWEAGQQPHRLEFNLFAGPGGGAFVARFIYRNEAAFGPNPIISASASGQSSSMPAPQPGIQHFTIARTGTQVDFYLDGSPFASFSGTSGSPIGGLGFLFLGPFPGELGDFHVDRVQVVPAPGVTVLLLMAVAVRKRKRC